MFSTWFSGTARERYRDSPYKDRIDLIGRGLQQQRYLDDVIRHHLQEWLRFANYVGQRGAGRPPDLRGERVRRYVVWRTRGRGASHLRFVRASVRIFLEADDAGQFPRRVGAAPLAVRPWFRDTMSSYLHFVQLHRGLGRRTVGL